LPKPGKHEVLIYKDRLGRQPYVEWLETLDWKIQERILARVARLGHGQFGDHKALGANLFELRLFFGPGYRVYFGEHHGNLVILLAGGDKSTQKGDIRTAKKQWETYQQDHP
jgi:putative addiction module killer protein